MPTMSQLRGTPLQRAELYGKPHVGGRYIGGKRYERTSGTCCICHGRAANCHHVAPLGCGETFTLVTAEGSWRLRSPLFALCGSGTTGCHNGFHGGARYVARWVWDDLNSERLWWDGTLLERFEQHAPELYGFGCWEIEDRDGGRIIEIREI